MRNDPSFGPVPPDEFKALVEAPHGQAVKTIRAKYDPLYGLAPRYVMNADSIKHHPAHFARAVQVACNKSNEGELPECKCHYPQCQEDGFYCFMMICSPKEAAVLIEAWEAPQRL